MKKTTLLLAAGVMAMLNGCVPAPPAGPADELSRYEWVLSAENQPADRPAARLCFEEGSLTLQTGDTVLLQGAYTATDHTLTVLSEACGVVELDYVLSSDQLLLTYQKHTARFIKG